MAKRGEVLSAPERAQLSRRIAASNLTTVAKELGIAIETCSRAVSGGRCNSSTIQLLRLRLIASDIGDQS